MAEIVKDVSLFHQAPATRAATSYNTPNWSHPWLYTSGNYDPTPEVYLEVTMKISDASRQARALLADTSGNVVTGSTITTQSLTPVRVRSGNLAANISNGTSYVVRISSSNATATTTIYAARLVIVQNGTIVKTETIFEFGQNTTNTTSTYAVDTNKGLWHNDDAVRDGTVTIYFEAFGSNNTAGQGCYAELEDLSGTYLSPSEVLCSGTTDIPARSAAITPADNTTYRIELKNSGSGTARLRAARLIVVQTNTPTKVESYRNLPYAFPAGVTSETPIVALMYWDDDELSVDSYSVYFESCIRSDSGSNTAYADLNDGSSDIVTVSNQSSSFALIRSSSFNPADNSTFDVQYRVSAGTVYSRSACLVIQIQITAADVTANQEAASAIATGTDENASFPITVSQEAGSSEAAGTDEVPNIAAVPITVLQEAASAILAGTNELASAAVTAVQEAGSSVATGADETAIIFAAVTASQESASAIAAGTNENASFPITVSQEAGSGISAGADSRPSAAVTVLQEAGSSLAVGSDEAAIANVTVSQQTGSVTANGADQNASFPITLLQEAGSAIVAGADSVPSFAAILTVFQESASMFAVGVDSLASAAVTTTQQAGSSIFTGANQTSQANITAIMQSASAIAVGADEISRAPVTVIISAGQALIIGAESNAIISTAVIGVVFLTISEIGFPLNISEMESLSLENISELHLQETETLHITEPAHILSTV